MGRQKTQVKGQTLELGLPPFFVSADRIFFSSSYFMYFLDSTPINGDTEQKTDDMEVEDKPKSPAREENNDDAASSPNR